MHGMNLLEELQEHVVCGDGAMGTLLLDQGLPMEACLEELSVSDPERVRSIHREYMAAGARVIETNSFGANAVRLARFDCRSVFENTSERRADYGGELHERSTRDGTVAPASPHRRVARCLSQRWVPALYRRSLHLSRGTRLFRARGPGDGGRRRAPNR